MWLQLLGMLASMKGKDSGGDKGGSTGWDSFKDQLAADDSGASAQLGMSAAKGRDMSQPQAPPIGIMGPPQRGPQGAPNVMQFQGMPQLPGPNTPGPQRGRQQMQPMAPQRLEGLMNRQPQPAPQEAPNMEGAKMNEYLRGLLYG